MKDSSIRLDVHCRLAYHREGQMTILSSRRPRYCAHQENVELERMKWWQLYISRSFSHTESVPDS